MQITTVITKELLSKYATKRGRIVNAVKIRTPIFIFETIFDSKKSSKR